MTPTPLRNGVWIGFATLPITLLVQSAVSAAIIAPAVAAPRLLEALHASTVVVGLYIAIVFGAAMISSQLGAPLVRRWGPIRTSQVSLGLCAAGLLLVALPQPVVAFSGAVLLGMGYGPITPASSEMLARTTPPSRIALVFSIKQTGVPLGGVFAGLIVPFVLTQFDARWAMVVMAAICVAGIGLAEALRNALDAHRDANSPLPELSRVTQPLRFVWAHHLLRRLALCTLVFSWVQVSFTSYLVSFLHDDLTWTIVAAGAALSIAQVSAIAGRIVWGLIADRWRGGARLTLFWLALAMALFGLAMPLLAASTPHAFVIASLVVYGATAIGWNGVFLGTVARVVPHDQAAMATAGSLFFTYFGVLIGSPLFGFASGAIGRIGPAFALLALPLGWTLWTLYRSDWQVLQDSA
ncbi:MAG: MFS transporter [Burkholderiaceae bacterium]